MVMQRLRSCVPLLRLCTYLPQQSSVPFPLASGPAGEVDSKRFTALGPSNSDFSARLSACHDCTPHIGQIHDFWWWEEGKCDFVSTLSATCLIEVELRVAKY